MESRTKPAGMREQIAFIACSKRKRRVPDKARKFYQGSLFKKALRYCEARFARVYILSGKYGLVELDEIISPYEKTLNRMGLAERKKWAEMVKGQLKEKNISGSFWFFTGMRYCEFFIGEKPLFGLSFGRQLQWFNKQERGEGFGL